MTKFASFLLKGRVTLEPILFTSNFCRGKNWQKFRKGQILVVVALDQHVWAKTSLIDINVISRYLQSRKHLAHWLCKNGSSYDYFRGFRAFVEFCDHVAFFTFIFPLLSFVLVFPPLLLLSTLGIEASEGDWLASILARDGDCLAAVSSLLNWCR